MRNILKIFKINNFTYVYFLACFFTGHIKATMIIFLIVLFHEIGHVLVSICFKYEITSIELFPFGGITKANIKINNSLNKSLLIYLGGILFQIILLLIMYLTFYLRVINNKDFKLFFYYNNIIMFFNLLCIYPLDGFHILQNFLERFMSFYNSLKIMGYISFIFLIVFMAFYHNNILIIVFLIFQFNKYYKQKDTIYNRFLLERYLYTFKYKKICYHYNKNLNKLRIGCIHMFKYHNKWYSEKELLAKKFDIKASF